MDKLLLLGVCVLKYHHIFCNSQSCNVLSTPHSETSHPDLGLDPDIECKKIWQPCHLKEKLKNQMKSKNVNLFSYY